MTNAMHAQLIHSRQAEIAAACGAHRLDERPARRMRSARAGRLADRLTAIVRRSPAVARIA